MQFRNTDGSWIYTLQRNGGLIRSLDAAATLQVADIGVFPYRIRWLGGIGIYRENTIRIVRLDMLLPAIVALASWISTIT